MSFAGKTASGNIYGGQLGGKTRGSSVIRYYIYDLFRCRVCGAVFLRGGMNCESIDPQDELKGFDEWPTRLYRDWEFGEAVDFAHPQVRSLRTHFSSVDSGLDYIWKDLGKRFTDLASELENLTCRTVPLRRGFVAKLQPREEAASTAPERRFWCALRETLLDNWPSAEIYRWPPPKKPPGDAAGWKALPTAANRRSEGEDSVEFGPFDFRELDCVEALGLDGSIIAADRIALQIKHLNDNIEQWLEEGMIDEGHGTLLIKILDETSGSHADGFPQRAIDHLVSVGSEVVTLDRYEFLRAPDVGEFLERVFETIEDIRRDMA